MEGRRRPAKARKQRQLLSAAAGMSYRRIGRRRSASGSSVQRKMRELQGLVPGGKRLHTTEQLILHTADYIFQLRFQVNVLKALSELYMP